MKETRIEDEVTIEEVEPVQIAELSSYEHQPKDNGGYLRLKIDKDEVARARALYITTDMSVAAIASQLKMNKHTLQRYCQNEKWSLLKQNPQFEDWSLEIVNEIYDKIDFYNDTQKLLHRLLLDENYQTPKDIKMIVEAYKVADERTTALRLIRENGNKTNGTDY